MLLKKYAMLAVKGFVSLFPKPLRAVAKRSPQLTAMYGRALHRSGLFYGLPNKKKLLVLYKGMLKAQQAWIDDNVKHFAKSANRNQVDNNKLDIFIVGFKRADINITLNSLQQYPDIIGQIFVQEQQVPSNFELSRPLEAVRTVRNWLELVHFSEQSILLLNAGDRVYPHSLTLLLGFSTPSSILYCDTDLVDDKNQRHSPNLLPDWNLELQASIGFVNTGVVIGRDLLDDSDLFSAKFLPSCMCIAPFVYSLAQQGYFQNNDAIKHIPLSLVQRKKGMEHERRFIDAMARYLKEQHLQFDMDEMYMVNRVKWPTRGTPLVSLIIPTKNGKELVAACINSILEKTTYQNFEILLIDNNSDDAEALAYFDELNQHEKIRVIKYPHPFNYSAINNFAVGHARGSVLGLVNNDIEVIEPEWLTYMAGHALRDEIGCVGAKLLYSDGRVQHAGVVMGYGGGAGHAHKYFPAEHPGYMNRLVATQSFSAVTAACLLVKKSLYQQVGGMNEQDLAVAFNDVDFCLRIRELGVRNVYCAEAVLYHHESVSRGLDETKEKMARFEREVTYLKTRWRDIIEHDPAYNTNLTLRRENFAIKDVKTEIIDFRVN